MQQETKCEKCRGSGFNTDISDKGIEIIIPLKPPFNIQQLKEYTMSKLCCSECKGKGKIFLEID